VLIAILPQHAHLVERESRLYVIRRFFSVLEVTYERFFYLNEFFVHPKIQLQIEYCIASKTI
jgi:hypothetical protein